MQWTEDMSVGVPIIDNRNRELINRLDGLRAAIKRQVCRYTIGDMLTFLEEYAEVHFCEEEQYMSQYGYPDYAGHKEKHEVFVTELNFLKAELHNIRALGLKGSYELSVETVQVVVDWVSGHVARDDKKFINYLKQHSNMNSGFISFLCGSKEYNADGIIWICSICNKIRGMEGLWKQEEHFGDIPSDILYFQDICPVCLQVHYADLFQKKHRESAVADSSS